MRLPFFGLLTTKSPLEGLREHYDKIAECVEVIKESLSCYVAGGACGEFQDLAGRVDELEAQADRIKRSIRNHLPRALFMPVEKTLFLGYTNAQDNVLDEAQNAMNWLAMRRVAIPDGFQKDFVDFLDEVTLTLEFLGPALASTVDFIYGREFDRSGLKNRLRQVRHQRDRVFRIKNELYAKVYNAEMDFKDIYQLIHFIEHLENMSHNASKCAETLRAMIAR